jgi:DNA mismatch repair protein MutS2
LEVLRSNTLGGFERAAGLLEFDQIRQRLAGYARTLMGQERARELTPAVDAREIGMRLQETDEARLFLDNGGGLEFGPGADLREYVQRAMLGGALRGEELHQVQQLAGAAGFNRKALAHRDDLPLLAGIAANIPNLSGLEDAIRRAISPAGEILDDASPELRQLRRDSRSAYQQLNDVMQRSLRRYQQRAVVQEPIITQRNGRLVLLIKAENKSQIPGIVHDVSDSGATVFIEPLPAIETGNRWRETRLAEEREEERVLRSLAARVGDEGDDLQLALDLLARLDLAMAKGRYSADRRAVAPIINTVNPSFDQLRMSGKQGSGYLTGGGAENSPPSPSKRGAGGESINSARGEPVEPRLRITGARHPLLTERVVPTSVQLGGDNGVMVITGPNAGGKTVALKTVGLLAMMAHAGLHVPAEAAEFPLLDGIYADIGDQQSIEQSLSTFSSHIQNLRDILAQVTARSLVLIDELGTSTDPEEGAALAQAILGRLQQRRVMTIATTHHRGVARYVQEQPGMVNASVDLEPGTLEPTYRITLGLPGRSYALTIADRMGLEPEILEAARSFIAPSQLATDDLVKELQEERAVVGQLRQEAEALLVQARTQQAETEARLATVESARLELVEEARQDLQKRISGLLTQLNQAERAAEHAEAEQAARRLMRPTTSAPAHNANAGSAAQRFRAYQEDLAQLQKELTSPAWEPIEVERTPWQEELRSGDRVYIRGIPRPVEVISPQDADEHLDVLLGTMRARIPAYQLERAAESGLDSGAEAGRATTQFPAADSGGAIPPNGIDPNNPGVRFRHNRDAGVYYRRPSPRQVKTDLDLRGQRVDDALNKVETLLNEAALSGVPEIRIIHGRGTGALRSAIRDYLRSHPLAASSGPEAESANDGVTVVELK